MSKVAAAPVALPRLLVSEILKGYNNPFHLWNDLAGTPLTRREITSARYDPETFRSKYTKAYTHDKSRHGDPFVRAEHIHRVRRCLVGHEAWPPLRMYHDTWDRFLLVDGHHRLLAAYLLGLTSVPVVWAGDWLHLCARYPESVAAGLLSPAVVGAGEKYWPGRRSYEKRHAEAAARAAARQ